MNTVTLSETQALEAAVPAQAMLLVGARRTAVNPRPAPASPVLGV